MLNIPVPPYYSAHKIDGPFILPFIPVILTKMDNKTGKELCILFSARVETLLIKEIDFFKEKFTIDYFILSDPNQSNINFFRMGYRGYSIIVTQSKFENRLSLNNSGEIGLDFNIQPRGKGIGSIILNHLFYWAKEKYPNYSAPYIKLSPVDEHPDNVERRNALYGNIGLLTKEQINVGDLTPRISSKGFQIRQFQEYEDHKNYIKDPPYSTFDIYDKIGNENLSHDQKSKILPDEDAYNSITSFGLIDRLKRLWMSN